MQWPNKHRLLLLLLLLSFFPTWCLAQHAGASDHFKPNYSWAVDFSASLSVEQIDQLRFLPLTSDTIPLHPENTLWLRFRWNGNSEEDAEAFFLVCNENISRIETWQFTQQDTFYHRGGFLVNYANRAFLPDQYTLPLTKQPAEVFLRFWDLERKGDYPFFCRILTETEEENARFQGYFNFRSNYIVFLVLLCVAFFLGLYAFFHYWFVFSKDYLFYGGYLAGIFLYYLRNLETNQPVIFFSYFMDWFYQIHFVNGYFIYLMYLLFVLHFLDLNERYPGLARIVKIGAWAMVGLMVLEILTQVFLGVNASSQLYKTANIALSVFAVGFLLALFKKVKSPLTWFIAIGTLFIILPGLFSALTGFMEGEYDFMSSGWYRIFKTDGVNLYMYSTKVGILLEILCFFLGLSYKARLTQQQKLIAEQDVAEAKQAAALSAFRNSFYTNITHEFRTPLSIILGIAKEVAGMGKEVAQRMKKIEISGNNLLRLVNNMLDLARIEAGALPVKMVQADIIMYLRFQIDLMQSVALRKQQKLIFQPLTEKLVTDFDSEKIQIICNNLLSNALKFTPNGGAIKMEVWKSGTVKAPLCNIQVSDNGIAITAEDLPHIFDRFARSKKVQENQGFGIGLSLTRELVELMGGHITVDSEPGRSATFTAILPISRKAAQSAMPLPQAEGALLEPFTWQTDNDKTVDDQRGKPRLLIVEDHLGMRDMIGRQLHKGYSLAFAKNGREGLEKAKDLLPDIIISDVMMPEMNGFELTHALKTDQLTNHIPVILLTALASAKDRIEGLEHGADAYLSKPFEARELELRLHNLLALRQRMRQRYSGSAFPAEESDVPLIRAGDTFMKNVLEIIETHLTDEQFNVEELARLIPMNRSSFSRKVKDLTGKDPSFWIRNTRMKKAKELLLTTDKSISKIGSQVGIEEATNFSRTFKDHFGKTPTQLRKNSR